jgi:hypothetical protein
MADYILEIDDVVSKEFCQDVISRFEKNDGKVIGATVGGINEKIKKSTDLPISSNQNKSEWQDVIDTVGDRVVDALADYQMYVDSEGLDRCRSIHKTINNASIGLPQIQRTDVNGFYTWHHDGYLNRTLTYILYLNDIEEGVGGTTEFLCGKTIQPKAGKIVLFPANLTYIHRGTKLKKGSKYLLTNFIYEGLPILEHPYHQEQDELQQAKFQEELNSNKQSLATINEIPEPENNDI